MAADALFPVCQLVVEFLVRGQLLAHSHKSPDNTNARFNRNGIVKYTGQHKRAVLRENSRKMANIPF